jgi:hypothetical protein
MCKQEKGRIMNIYAKKTYQEEEEDFRLRRLASFTLRHTSRTIENYTNMGLC